MSSSGWTRVLVVGHSGQLAQSLLEAATSCPVRLIALGRPDVDIADAASLERAFVRVKPDLVINAAAYTAVDRAESERDTAMRINGHGPGRLATACRHAMIPFIHVSSDMVFPDRPDMAGFRETDPVGPLSHYGASKLEGERQVQAAGGASLIARVSWVFSPFADNFVRKLVDMARTRTELKIVMDQRGRPTYAPRLASVLLDLGLRMGAGETAERPSGLLHLAGEDVMSRDEQARLVMAACQARGGPYATVVPVPTSEFQTPAKRALNAVLDVERARTQYGVSLGGFADGLDATLDRLFGPPSADQKPKLHSDLGTAS